MLATICLGIITTLLAYFARRSTSLIYLKISFIFIFIFSALRYNFGNDYFSYYRIFLEITQQPSIDWSGKYIYLRIEPAWILLNWLFKPFGFFAMVAFLAIFNCYAYYNFIKKYVPSNYYWFAIFIYVFSPYFLLIQLSAMRQATAIGFFLISLDYLLKKDVWRYCICIAFASLFHTSAIFLLPVYFLRFGQFNLNIAVKTWVFIIFIISLCFSDFFQPYIRLLVTDYIPIYAHYENPSDINTGWGVIYNSIMLGFILYYAKYLTVESSFFFKIAILSFFVIPLTLVVSMIDRISLYLQTALLTVYPIIFSNTKAYIRIPIICLIFLYVWVSFYMFFKSPIYIKFFSNYQTILTLIP